MSTAASPTNPHPWIVSLQASLDRLETALLQGDAPGVELGSAAVQSVLRAAPRPAEFNVPGSTLRTDLQQAAQHFGRLRPAVQRASAQSERALHSLLPQQAPATYGPRAGARPSTGGAGRAYLSA
jgi:hypothetical protein